MTYELAQVLDYRFESMEKKMETAPKYWGYIGIVETKMETAIHDGNGKAIFWIFSFGFAGLPVARYEESGKSVSIPNKNETYKLTPKT